MQAQGKIIDIKSNQPLPLATITITDSSGAGIDVNKRTSADKEGFFKISVMPKPPRYSFSFTNTSKLSTRAYVTI